MTCPASAHTNACFLPLQPVAPTAAVSALPEGIRAMQTWIRMGHEELWQDGVWPAQTRGPYLFQTRGVLTDP